MEVAKEKSHARHAWLYQAEEEFEKVSLEFENIGTFLGDGIPVPQVQGLGDSLIPLSSHVTIATER